MGKSCKDFSMVVDRNCIGIVILLFTILTAWYVYHSICIIVFVL
jgi:hypothetical protein